MSFDILIANILVSPEARVQPDARQGAKAQLGDDPAMGELCHVQAATAAKQDAQQVRPSEPAVDLEQASFSESGQKLERTDENGKHGGDNMDHQERQMRHIDRSL